MLLAWIGCLAVSKDASEIRGKKFVKNGWVEARRKHTSNRMHPRLSLVLQTDELYTPSYLTQHMGTPAPALKELHHSHLMVLQTCTIDDDCREQAEEL